ncbi:MAG TPA: S46 family peptidase [Phycisphaerae bacterium]|nr:S46 family peptidase [Phycisphaerae bacterium]HRY67211.1 S46 family peptidase [Phycisphaerae bacterium]HSA26419.1 S46 family peptidase [Phycisphaerae bacterium]
MRSMIVRSPILLSMLIASAAAADEGMWLLSNPPTATLRSKYNFDPTPAWLEHLQKATVRIGGGTGSLVSADGLILTNHHVGSDQIYNLSTPDRDLLKTGFIARTRDQELKCRDLEIKLLWSIEDVTDKVNAAADPSLSVAKAFEARRKAMTRIEQESKDATGLDSEIVTLYKGGRYHLYRYRRYTDVRLVMAPEQSAAFFGGDVDNFEFPRFNLDCCFFRVYENDKPLKAEHYLRVSTEGSHDGELLLVAGHPGHTQRLITADHLRFLRDVEMPDSLRRLWRREAQMNVFCSRSPEHARIGHDALLGIENGRKARTGIYAGLLDPAVMTAREQADARLKAVAATQPALADGNPWERLVTARKLYGAFFQRHRALGGGLGSTLFGMAVTVVRLSEELPKPSPDRLREYRDSELESVYLGLYSPSPIYEALEIEALTSGLSLLAETLGADDPAVVRALDGRPPAARAEQLVKGCTLKNIETRKRLVKEGKKAVEASPDPMIRLAITMDPESRTLRKRFEDEIEGVERDAYARIAAVQFALYGESLYPDATGTLRLAFGQVKGYEHDGTTIPPYTTIAGWFERYKERGPQPPFEIPKSWLNRRDRIRLDTPFNFVFTADIIGGNSGSPVVNARGEVAGLIFDGNIQSLVWDIAYDDRQGRAVAVDIRAIIEALRSVYDLGFLADELTRR